MKINQMLCPPGLKNNPNKKLKEIGYVTIHTTGDPSPTATAKAEASYQYNGSGGREASWHYSVDNLEIWQSFPDDAMCWHSGTAKGNESSIGIEICDNLRSGFVKACDNAAQLTASLLKTHNLPISKVVQHNYWSGKDCPLEIRRGDWGINWTGFLDLVKKYYAGSFTKTPIMSTPTANADQMSAWAQSKNAARFFIELAPAFYGIGVKVGVNPVAAYAQSAKEMAYGRFGGVLDASFCNTCGLKTRQGGSDSDKNAHARFKNWYEGITAQYDHLALYAGSSGYPKIDSPDPRQFPSIFGTAAFVEDLSLAWAPGADYGSEVARLMKEIESVEADMSPPETNIPTNRYKNISEIPEWGKRAIQALVSIGAFADPENLDLSYDMLRIFVVLEAANGI